MLSLLPSSLNKPQIYSSSSHRYVSIEALHTLAKVMKIIKKWHINCLETENLHFIVTWIWGLSNHYFHKKTGLNQELYEFWRLANNAAPWVPIYSCFHYPLIFPNHCQPLSHTNIQIIVIVLAHSVVYGPRIVTTLINNSDLKVLHSELIHKFIMNF